MVRARYTMMALVLGAGCGRGGGGSGGAPHLDGALAELPVFAPAALIERRDAFTSDTVDEPMKFSTYTWHLRTHRSPEEVEAFYLAQWPRAGRVTDDDAIRLRDPPLPYDPDPDDEVEPPLGESTSVTIYLEPERGLTRFSITEDVFAARRP